MHDGHRERMRAKIEKYGTLDMPPHEVLEYILYSFVPRKDTNALAHRLLDEFGTLAGVMNAETRFLKEVPGMTENAALFLHTMPDIISRYLAEITKPENPKSGMLAVRNHLGSIVMNRQFETVCVAALDVHEKMIACDIISSGGNAKVRLDVKTVVDYAQKHKAFGIVLAHNHPNGNIDPSKDDISLTYDIFCTLQSLGYHLLDHYIFCGENCYSFKDNDQLQTFMTSYSTYREGVWTNKTNNK